MNGVQIQVGASRPKDRKDRILAAAAELVAARGFAAVGVDEIAARVGVTGPAIYRHFRTKEELLDTLLKRTVEGFTEIVDTSPQGELDQLMGAVVGHVLDHPSEAASYMRERAGSAGGPPKQLAVTEQRFRSAWRRALRDHFAPLDPTRIAIRQQAVLEAMAMAARHPQGVTRPRLDELLIRSSTAVLRAPTIQEALVPGAGQRAWVPKGVRRERVLTAALALFRARGVSGTGMDEIGAAVGISGPAIYHYYPSKAELVLDAFERASERISIMTSDALLRATSAHDALSSLVQTYVDIAMANLDLIVVTSREGMQLPEGERQRFDRRAAEVRERFELVLDELHPDLTTAECRVLVRSVFPSLNGAVVAAGRRVGLSREIVGLGVAHLLCERSFETVGSPA